MIIEIKKDEGVVRKLEDLAREWGVRPEVIRGDAVFVVGFKGDTSAIDENSIIGIEGVLGVFRISHPYKIIAREITNGKGTTIKRESKKVSVSGRIFGGEKPIYIAGPCAVESREQLTEIATGLKEVGEGLGILERMMLRGGAYKPRSSAYAFRGLGEEGLKYLQEAKEITGMPVVTEIMDIRHVDLFEKYGVDMYQIGARNWQNHALLTELGKAGKPVLYKRGMYADLEEWLAMAEFIAREGNENIVLCERGLSNRLSGDYHRNQIDFDVIGGARKQSILPIIIDPSHGTGFAESVPRASKAAIQCYGANGLIIEVIADETNVAKVKCDGAQSIRLSQYRKLLGELK